MIKPVFQKILATSLILALVSGCASDPVSPVAQTQPPAKPSAQPGTPTPTSASNADQTLAAAFAQPPAPFVGEGWKPLFDSQTLTGWKLTEFGGHGPVECESGHLLLGMGAALTGLIYTNDVPNLNYELALDAMRVQGSDFFCGLTFPVGESHCSHFPHPHRKCD